MRLNMSSSSPERIGFSAAALQAFFKECEIFAGALK